MHVCTLDQGETKLTMANKKQPLEKKTFTLKQECSYLTHLIQQHKLDCSREGTSSLDLQKPAKVGLYYRNLSSKYKKVNTNLKHDNLVMDTIRLNTNNMSTHNRTFSRVNKKDSVLLTPSTSYSQENQLHSFAKPSSSSGNSKMYLNPQFFKLNSSLLMKKPVNIDSGSDIFKLKPNIHINPAKSININSESINIPKLKHTIHINPVKSVNRVESVDISNVNPSVHVNLHRVDISKLKSAQYVHSVKIGSSCAEFSELRPSIHINPAKSINIGSESAATHRLKPLIHVNPAKAINLIAENVNDVSKLKSSVHVNPKVLAQVMKLNIKTEVTAANMVANKQMVSDMLEKQLQICKPHNTASDDTSGYVFRSKMKLVKQNPLIQHSSTNNTNKLTGRSAQFVPKKKLSPLMKSSLSGQLMSISRTKLVRAKPRRLSLTNNQSFSVPSVLPMKVKSIEQQTVCPKMPSCSGVRRNSRSSSVAVKVAKAVCSKYKLSRIGTGRTPTAKSRYSYTSNKALMDQKSRYKIDRRSLKTPKRFKKVKKYSLQYEVTKRRSNQHRKSPKVIVKYKKVPYSFTGYKFGNKIWKNCLRPQRVMVTNKKLMRIGNSPNLRNGTGQQNGSQKTSLVTIGGVLYKTSKLKLTRSVTPRGKGPGVVNCSMKKTKSASSYVVYVRGNKFLMDATGKTLLRVPQRSKRNSIKDLTMTKESNAPVKRIDIGGVTFVQKSTNVLIRTNTHNARSLLSQAKQKSIAMLTNKLRKNNKPCIFYHRFGKCVRKEKGTCPHVHDPKQVAICKKFLQGCCEITGCTLSHDVGPEKMPTCKYFLEGCCVRDNCPYLHVKVNAKAVICKNFLLGYCSDGQKCKKRHTYLCPDFEKVGKCPKGKYCPYPHKPIVKKLRTKKCLTSDKTKITVSNQRKRYYESGVGALKESGAEYDRSLITKDIEASDLDAKRRKLLKKVDEMKRTWLNAQDHSDLRSSDVQNMLPESKADTSDEPEAKRPKLGILPAYIPLGFDL